ncbi:hypothetical protein DN051_36230 [Streptomyces cadmiisoli]|uniref:Cupin type-2 domain-containing protein n=2 Tax=Streptomyces cadmiisoli TaxID=2184053 RepID=A0A2Z4J8S0_9ACTN|nr:hypothetical protein DN051_36230 [Streptomyces cadmiisoli]
MDQVEAARREVVRRDIRRERRQPRDRPGREVPDVPVHRDNLGDARLAQQRPGHRPGPGPHVQATPALADTQLPQPGQRRGVVGEGAEVDPLGLALVLRAEHPLAVAPVALRGRRAPRAGFTCHAPIVMACHGPGTLWLSAAWAAPAHRERAALRGARSRNSHQKSIICWGDRRMLNSFRLTARRLSGTSCTLRARIAVRRVAGRRPDGSRARAHSLRCQEMELRIMTFNFAVPDKDDPVWTSADGFVVRNEEGIVRLTGEERFAVRVTGAQSNGRLGVMEGTVAPRFGNVPHTHRQEDEAFLILSGRFRFINGDQTFEAGPGDFVYIPHGTRHGFKNILDVPSKMMVFYTPAGPEQFFVDHGMREDTYDPQEWANRLRNDTALQKALAGMNMSLLPGGHDWAE